MSRRGWEGVVVVMPPFAKTEDSENEIVPAFIVAIKGLFTPQVADGVDAERCVMNKKYARRATPKETEGSAHPGARHQTTDRGRNRKSQNNPKGEQTADSTR